MAVIDTSGSITPELLELINAELASLAGDYRVTVVECDVKIHRVYPYRKIREVQGRGGTDFTPPFKPAFLRQHRPDLVIYFTDGFGPAPERAPRIPTIWCLTPIGERPCKWGRVIQMEAGTVKK
jgi:predicted metal-dependent peptidase